MNQSALVSTQFLHDHLGDDTIVILDGTYIMPGPGPTAFDAYKAYHIPGARFFDIDKIADQSSPLPHMIPEAEEFAASMQDLGISSDHHVVVYDQHGLFSAARVWWMFRTFGHDKVSVLDGGLPKWHKERRPSAKNPPTPSPAAKPFCAQFRPELVRDAKQILADLDQQKDQLVDARSPERFAGQVIEPRPGLRSGHIPASKNLFFMDLVDRQTGCLKPKTELAEIFKTHDIVLTQPTIAYCGSGVTACIVALAAHVLGYPDMAVYDGSWTEWGALPNVPIATGSPPE